ncbi:DMT family transporter [Alteromonas sp. ASW11-19]|uniref:DMT family transporter n=2 Tax=Alteromonas salexigens TaxID=2982530 RepID=A0ABT2VQ83_9ALTE|nr:DMT family transporter [Alteromonas salexigens]
MLAFAANSLLCRMALVESATSPGMFTAIRLASGALLLLLLAQRKPGSVTHQGSWKGAGALFVYAAAFSFAYVSMTTGTGALLLFGAVQLTMIGYGWLRGEQLRGWQIAGLLMALSGLVVLLLPGISPPPLTSAFIMLVAGIAWGTYSILGKGAVSGLAVTTGNFVYSLVFVAALLAVILALGDAQWDLKGVLLGVGSGAIASALGYAVWYYVLPYLSSTNAATIQLSVPVFAVLAGWLFLGEPITAQIVLSSVAILSGIAVVIRRH